MENKLYSIIFLVLIIVVGICRCSLRKENPLGIRYDKEGRKVLFCVEKKMKNNLQAKIYWNDSLLCMPYIEYNDEVDSCFIDIFPNKQIGGYSAKPYLLDICYQYAKDRRLSLQYVLEDRFNNKILFDTILQISNIVEREIVERFDNMRKIQEPIVRLEGSGFEYIRSANYYTFVKGTLYSKKERNINDSILWSATALLDAFLNEGYRLRFIPQTDNIHFGKIANQLSIHIADSIPKIYLLMASLSGEKHINDFSFKTEQEISEFVGYEYARDFENATNNNGGYLKVPIKKIGNHKYNFVQVVFAVYILNNGDYQYIPIAYIITRDPQEMGNALTEEGSVKLVTTVSKKYYIGTFLIHYYGINDLF